MRAVLWRVTLALQALALAGAFVCLVKWGYRPACMLLIVSTILQMAWVAWWKPSA